MSEHALEWSELVDRAAGRGFFANVFYAILTYPVKGMDEIESMLPDHLAYQVALEEKGIMFAAGPLCDVPTDTWQGRGLVVIRAASLEEAGRIAEADPMHASGTRRFEVIPWLVNEGAINLTVRLSKGGLGKLS